MPMFMDIHDIPGVTAAHVADVHHLNMQVQDKYGVNYVKYWLNEKQGKAYCLVTAPTAEAADAVHREAHVGMVASRIIEVDPEMGNAFMGAAEVDAGGAALLPGNTERDPGTRTVVFTDIVDSTRMTQRFGDEKALALLGVHDRIVRDALAATRGREIKHTGDGIMAAFTSAVSAIRCAMDVQRTLAQHNAESPDQRVQVRIGVAAGEPIEHHADLFGSTVQLAARLCAHAEPDQILVSRTVAELCLGKALPFKDLGLFSLKGFDQPVHVHSISSASRSSSTGTPAG